MPLVPAICTQCGSQLEVDSTSEATLCPHCKTPFVTEKAINNYTNVTKIETLHADVVNVSNEHSIDNQVLSGDTFIKLEKYEDAERVFKSLTDEHPYDYRSWMGMTKVLSRNYTDFDVDRDQLNEIISYCNSAKKVATDVEGFSEECDNYIQTVDNTLNNLKATSEKNISQLKATHSTKTQTLQNEIAQLQQQRADAAFPETKVKLCSLFIAVVIGLIGLADSGIIFGIILGIISFFVVKAIATRVLEPICWKKANELTLQITSKQDEICALDNGLKNDLLSQRILLGKATGQLPDEYYEQQVVEYFQ